MKKRLIFLIILIVAAVILLAAGGIAAFAEDGKQEINDSISSLLEDLDLSELQKYLDEHSDSYLFNFGDTAVEIVQYLIHGNVNTDYGGYLSELFSVIFKNVIALIPAFS